MTTTVVNGDLRGYQDKNVFSLRARKDLTTTTAQGRSSSSSRPITVYLKDPTGADVGEADASCNNRRQISPTVAGTYRVEIVECQKADPWRGDYKLKISLRFILPRRQTTREKVR